MPAKYGQDARQEVRAVAMLLGITQLCEQDGELLTTLPYLPLAERESSAPSFAACEGACTATTSKREIFSLHYFFPVCKILAKYAPRYLRACGTLST